MTSCHIRQVQALHVSIASGRVQGGGPEAADPRGALHLRDGATLDEHHDANEEEMKGGVVDRDSANSDDSDGLNGWGYDDDDDAEDGDE